jgi:TrpR-related protein YerC/YecD
MYVNITDKDRLLLMIRTAVATKNDKLLLDFLCDILTEQEISACEQRLKAMCMLYDGQSYDLIKSITGLSSATIARLSKKVRNNQKGFMGVIEKMKDKKVINIYNKNDF